MSFGFSAGDFIAALELVATVIDALRESGGAGSEYREVVRQLYSLETALLRVKRLEVDPAQNAELVSLQQAAAQCQQTIDNFWEKVQKYQPHLRAGGSSSRLKDGWMKIKWTVCKKEDLAKFKADLVGHTESIQLLLMAMQMASANLHEKHHDQNIQSLASKIQDTYFGCLQRLSNISQSLQSGIEQGKNLLEMTTKVMQTNIQVFQVVLDIQKFISRIPGQIDRQQPVYFIDALGRSSPFHLEFVRSAEALVSVLKANFKKVGHASEMIERGDFIIQDSASKRDVNLEKDWELCFSPGQRVEMGMIFKRPTRPTNSCPTCKADCGGSTEEEVDCPKCGLNFRRVLDLGNVPNNTSNTNRIDTTPVLVTTWDTFDSPLPNDILELKCGKIQEEIDEVSLYRRVRIYNVIDGPFLPDLRSDLDYRAKLCQGMDDDWRDFGTGLVNITLEDSELKDRRQIPFLNVQYESVVFSIRISLELNYTLKSYPGGGTVYISTDDYIIKVVLDFKDSEACAEIWRYIDAMQSRSMSAQGS